MGQLLGANFALQGRPCPFKAVTVLRDEEKKMDSDNSWSCSSSFIYCVQGQRKEAMENYQRASTNDPNNTVARAGLGRVQGGVGSLFN